MFLSLSFLWNALPVSISLSRLTTTNDTLPFHVGAILSHAGSSFAHGLHHDAPTVITRQPLIAFNRNGLPLGSTAVSSSAMRSPTLSVLCAYTGPAHARRPRIRRKRMGVGRRDPVIDSPRAPRRSTAADTEDDARVLRTCGR